VLINPQLSSALLRPILSGGAVAALAIGMVACGGESAATPGKDEAAPAADGACFTIPEVAPNDPSGVVASLPKDLQAGYAGYPAEILPSAWADWKPDHEGPYKVGIIWQPPINPLIVQMHEDLKKTLKESGEVEIIADLAPQNPMDVPGALQLFDQVVAQKPDMIIMAPLASEAFVDKIEQAGKAGIPVSTPLLPVASEYAIGSSLNNWLTGATLATKVAEEIDGTGNVLVVRGIPGVQLDTDVAAGYQSVLDRCPNLNVAGEVVGNFNVADAKSAVLQFLSSHTGNIDAVLQVGVMTPGVIQAFEQLGRPVPVIADSGSTQASVAYAHENAEAYPLIGNSDPTGQGTAFAEIALRTLHGDGPLVNQMVSPVGLLTSEDVPGLFQEGWNIGSLDAIQVDEDVFLTSDELDALFTR
jgi:ribose transport system substrate-binding protein